jgi:GPH family glycoside/pentoside/hexuronide:cation symporter
MVLQFFASITGGPLSALIWAMYADTADYGEWKNKRRATGLVFSAAIFGQKIGWALGAWFIGLLLQKFGFDPDKDIQQVEGVRSLIRALMSFVPMVAAAVSIILTLFYKLSDNKMKEIEADLDTWRKKEEIADA